MFRSAMLSAVLFFFALPSYSLDLSFERQIQIQILISSFDRQTLVQDVQIIADPNFKGIAGAKGNSPDKKIIVYNLELMAKNPRAAVDFIFFHELGHIHLGHTKLPYPGKEGAVWAELEADFFACRLSLQYQTEDGRQQFIEWARTAPSVPTERLAFFIKHLSEDRSLETAHQ